MTYHTSPAVLVDPSGTPRIGISSFSLWLMLCSSSLAYLQLVLKDVPSEQLGLLHLCLETGLGMSTPLPTQPPAIHASLSLMHLSLPGNGPSIGR